MVVYNAQRYIAERLLRRGSRRSVIRRMVLHSVEDYIGSRLKCFECCFETNVMTHSILVYGLTLSVGTERSNCSSHEQEVGFTLSLIPA